MATALGCTAPSAQLARAIGLLARSFDDDLEAAREGDALVGDAALGGRVLLLAAGMRNLTGSLGSLILNKSRHVSEAAVIEFEASFAYVAWGGGGGEGLSFNYGPLPSALPSALPSSTTTTDSTSTHSTIYGRGPFTSCVSVTAHSERGACTIDERGTRQGLSVQLLTAVGVSPPRQMLRVSFGGEVLEEVPLGITLRTRVWANVSIGYTAEGLSVGLDGKALVRALPLYGYLPTAEWQFSLGARAGPFGDWHRVDNVRIRSGDLLVSGR